VLDPSQFAVSPRGALADTRGQQPGLLGPLQQCDVANVVGQIGVLRRGRQHQKLHRKFGIDHAARRVLDVELFCMWRRTDRANRDGFRGYAGGRNAGISGWMRGADLFAHGDDFVLQRGDIARRHDDAAANGFKALAQQVVAQHETRPRHGLVFPGPGGVAAALLLVVGISRKTGHQQAGISVRPQGGVDLVQIALAGLYRQPVDQLAHKSGIHLGRALMIVFVNEHDVQVTAVAQLFAAQFSVGNDGNLRRFAVPLFQALPAPVRRYPQHRFSQRAQVIGHLLDRQHAFNVARQRAEYFGMAGTAKQVQAGFFVIFAGAFKRRQTLLEFTRKQGSIEAFVQHLVAGQLVNDARVLQQITRWPPRCAQQAQQALVHGRALQQ